MTGLQLISLFATCLSILTGLFGSGVAVKAYSCIQEEKKRQKAQELGVQALLRDRLYSMYYKYKAVGYRSPHGTENFENIWIQYENLGKNGVMLDIRNKFYELPIQECM